MEEVQLFQWIKRIIYLFVSKFVVDVGCFLSIISVQRLNGIRLMWMASRSWLLLKSTFIDMFA